MLLSLERRVSQIDIGSEAARACEADKSDVRRRDGDDDLDTFDL